MPELDVLNQKFRNFGILEFPIQSEIANSKVSEFLNRVKLIVFFLFILIIPAVVPAFAQIDFSGEWTPNGNEDSIGNPYVGDWLGFP